MSCLVYIIVILLLPTLLVVKSFKAFLVELQSYIGTGECKAMIVYASFDFCVERKQIKYLDILMFWDMSREAIGQLPHNKASGVINLATLKMCFKSIHLKYFIWLKTWVIAVYIRTAKNILTTGTSLKMIMCHLNYHNDTVLKWKQIGYAHKKFVCPVI